MTRTKKNINKKRKSGWKAPEWQTYAERRLAAIIEISLGVADLKSHLPVNPNVRAEVQVLARRDAIQRLNQKYRQKDVPTDVLSFEAPEPFRQQGFWGELIICLPVAREQARRLGHSVELEINVLLVHGYLHLLGFDHEKSQRAAREMQRLEDCLLLASLPKKLLGSDSLGLIARSS